MVEEYQPARGVLWALSLAVAAQLVVNLSDLVCAHFVCLAHETCICWVCVKGLRQFSGNQLLQCRLPLARRSLPQTAQTLRPQANRVQLEAQFSSNRFPEARICFGVERSATPPLPSHTSPPTPTWIPSSQLTFHGCSYFCLELWATSG